MSSIPIILLAAGASSRMGGGDKLMRSIEGEPLLRRTARRALSAGPVHVALPPEPHPRHAALSGLDVHIVPVPDAAEGMNASLRRTLATIPPAAPAAMVLLADLPDITNDDLNNVMQAVDLKSDTLIWRGTAETGKPGHPVVFARSLFPELLTLTGDAGAQSVAHSHADQTICVPLPGHNALRDLDTEQDWSDWLARQ
ncbi:nucleotidyltransferase family protein [Ruegeria sp. 2205SS24-7]|uniref:nucleotidyltransferase family protein n=1 Tax=Ruegeria discodermiae TaxID=3064389 RepID=UPI0027423AAB|nr:nucleotidyltransferase family protein [Ruegeria sp. 2205SS24-7]MDP5216097.1 nucleotidyltransferase family protein [Ruegeria sp. 2205SS24-7]